MSGPGPFVAQGRRCRPPDRLCPGGQSAVRAQPVQLRDDGEGEVGRKPSAAAAESPGNGAAALGTVHVGRARGRSGLGMGGSIEGQDTRARRQPAMARIAGAVRGVAGEAERGRAGQGAEAREGESCTAALAGAGVVVFEIPGERAKSIVGKADECRRRRNDGRGNMRAARRERARARGALSAPAAILCHSGEPHAQEGSGRQGGRADRGKSSDRRRTAGPGRSEQGTRRAGEAATAPGVKSRTVPAQGRGRATNSSGSAGPHEGPRQWRRAGAQASSNHQQVPEKTYD